MLVYKFRKQQSWSQVSFFSEPVETRSRNGSAVGQVMRTEVTGLRLGQEYLVTLTTIPTNHHQETAFHFTACK